MGHGRNAKTRKGEDIDYMEKVDSSRSDPLASNGFACEATDEDIAGAAFAGVGAAFAGVGV